MWFYSINCITLYKFFKLQIFLLTDIYKVIFANVMSQKHAYHVRQETTVDKKFLLILKWKIKIIYLEVTHSFGLNIS